MLNKDIKEWQDLIDFEAELRKEKNNYFFRGVFDEKCELDSSYRRKNEKKWTKEFSEKIVLSANHIIENAQEQIEYMRSKNPNLRYKDDLEILAELQHHGTSTLLIDFTSNFWTALWFAISNADFKNNSDNNRNFKLFYLKLENKKDIQNSIKNYYGKEVYHCPEQILNGLAQNSYFILDNSNTLEKDWKIESVLIPYKLQDCFIKLLDINKINSITIFPGLKGLAQSFENYSKEFFLITSAQLLEMDKTEKALEYCEKALKIDPNFSFAWHNKGLIFSKLNNFKDCYICLKKAIQLDPTIYYFYNTLGTILANSKIKTATIKDKEDGIKYIDQSIKLNPNLFGAHFNKGQTLAELGKYEEAIDSFNEVLKLNPNYLDAYISKGVSLSKLGKNEDADICFNEAIKLNSIDVFAYINKGVNFTMWKKFNKANIAFDKAIELEDNHFEAYYGKGFSLFNLASNNKDLYSEAITYFNKAISLKPTNHLAYKLKGDSFYKLNNYNDALKSYKEALKLDPSNNYIKEKIKELEDEMNK